MSLENKVGRAVYDLLEIVKNRVASDILAARTDGHIIIGGDNELTNLLTTVNASLDVTFGNGVDHILNIVKTTETKAVTKPKRKTTSKSKA